MTTKETTMTDTTTRITDLPSLDVEMTPRQIAIHALRTTTVEQCRGTSYGKDGSMCATAIVAEALGFQPFGAGRVVPNYKAVARSLGLASDSLWRLNDGLTPRTAYHPMSFKEIADWLEALP